MTHPALLEQAPRKRVIDLPQRQLVAHEWGAAHRGLLPSILLVHATGFHGRCWDQVVARLGPRHVIAVDQRGHGESTNAPFDDWRAMGGDLVAVARHLRLSDAYGVGHSMGGTALLHAAQDAPECFGGLMLIDPVILTPEIYTRGENPMAAAPGTVNPIARRFDDFDDPAAMLASLAGRMPYALFEPAVLRDYCRYGLRPDRETGSWRLACRPADEAKVYEAALNHDPHLSLPDVRQRVTVVRAMQPTAPEHRRSFLYSPTDPALAQCLPDGRDLLLKQFTHFLPMQDPGFCAGLVLGAEPDSRGADDRRE